MNIVGIDPGKQGAIAVISQEGELLELWDMPTTEIEVVEIMEKIKEKYSPLIVGIEVQGYRPGQKGINELLTRFGFLLGVIQTLRLKNERFTPNKWKRKMGVMLGKKASSSEKKKRAIEKACQLFPEARIGKKDGRAEALLIAEYTRRIFLGGANER